MSKQAFYVKATWDEEAGVFYSESDIEGLHLEAETLEDFQAALMDVAIELILANHISASDFANKPLKDLIPAIFWRAPNDDDCHNGSAQAFA
ncbi:MAG: DUF1902 domain-containing protein [Parvibaculum sp.]|nr:DUF1902 domain-containing protein [Parvibaculum sp.]